MPLSSRVLADGLGHPTEPLLIQHGADATDCVRVDAEDAVHPCFAGATLAVPPAGADVLPEAPGAGLLGGIEVTLAEDN